MENIFTFDFEEPDIPGPATGDQITKEPLHTNTYAEPFVFDEQEEDEPPQHLANHIKEANRQVEQKGIQKQVTKQSTASFSYKEPVDKENVPAKDGRKPSQRIMPGMEVQDLGTNDMEYVCEKKALKVSDLRKFLNTPLGDYKVKAVIKKQGGFLGLNAIYRVYIEQNNRFLFSISRDGICQYNFSLSKHEVSEKKKDYLGKMRCNMAGTEFLLYDSGFSPSETRSLEFCRKQLASITYETSSGPRKFSAIVATNCQGYYALNSDEDTIKSKWERKQREFLSILHSKSPQFDPEDGRYKLNFKGNAKKASIKNFILGGAEWEDSLIFGKVTDDSYMMEIKEPLSVLQAAAICLSSVHYKFSFI